MKGIKREFLASLLVILIATATVPAIGTQANFVKAGSNGASLTGKLSTDEGVDSDSNGLFDYLDVEVEVNVVEAGSYRICVSGFIGSNSNYISVYSEKTPYLNVGLSAVTLSLQGTTIYLSGVNPVNVSSIYLYDGSWDGTWLNSAYNVPLSHEYSYTEFELPPAVFTDRVFDEGVDTDSDGLFNVLQVGVQVNVTEAGTYNICINDLEDGNYSRIPASGSTYASLGVGVHLVNFSLDGRSIRASGINPAYVSGIWLYFYGNYSYSDSANHVPLQKTYSYLDFDPPEAVLTGNILDSGVDRDGDSKFNYLQVGVEINVTEPVSCSLNVYGLLGPPLNSSSNYISVSGYASGHLDAGLHMLNVSLDGLYIYLSKINPITVSSIQLDINGSSSYLNSVPLINEYEYADFDAPGANLTGSLVDYGVDTDGDGKYNYLQVGIEINVTDEAYYSVGTSQLLDIYNSSISVSDSEYYVHLLPGVNWVYLQFDGLQIRLSGLSPRYIGHTWLNQDYLNIGSIDNVPLSQEYSNDAFEVPDAVFTGEVNDLGVDTDGDGWFNQLIVEVEVNVSKADQYTIYIPSLLDPSLYYIYVSGYQYTYLDVGAHLVNVSLYGLGIRLSERNPSYISQIFLQNNEGTCDTLNQVPLSREYACDEFEPPGAVLTGGISDNGIDTDADGTYDYLRIGVEVNVTDPGTYQVSINDLLDSSFNYIDVDTSNITFLEAGTHNVYLYLDGTRIYLSGLNPRFVDYIYLSDMGYGFSEQLTHVPLGVEYSYRDFDPPSASLTGTIYDRGVDSDGDGAFNYLDIGVELNVTKAGVYRVGVDGLLDSSLNYVGVNGYQEGVFEVGVQVLNVSMHGPSIYQSHLNPKYVDRISLYADYYDFLEDFPLSREYSYKEFDFPAVLTGIVSDKGVDMDGDSYFDYLEIGVQINVSDAGTYVLQVSGLSDSYSNYINVYDYRTIYLDKEIHTTNLYLYGPQIHVSQLDPAEISGIYLAPRESSYYQYSDTLYHVSLSREYSHDEFDAPLIDVEAELVVYPDGRVAVEGALKYTNMLPQNWPRYFDGEGYLNITGDDASSQASAGMRVNLPPEADSEFPFNATTLEMLGDYSNGMLDFGINSTVILPPILSTIYPYNSTGGKITATYSGGLLNIEAEGNTTFPSLASKQFPLNATDVTVVGTYSSNTLSGTITFSILDDFTFDDVSLDFEGDQNDFSLNGTVHLVFNVPFGGFIIHNETELVQLIDQLKSNVPGEGGVVWNMTDGLLNVTALDIDYTLNGVGASVMFRISVHGDFVHALAYLLSGGRNEMLLYPVLSEAYECVQGGSFDVRYSHDTLEASVKLTLSYDLKRLVDYVFTATEETEVYVVVSGTMYPTLQVGDLIYTEPVNASDIIVDSQNGDIILFQHPSSSGVFVAHRAIGKTLVNDTLYFQTKGDGNYSPDYWSGPGTLDGMASSELVLGRVFRRVPIVGYLIYAPLYYFGYPRFNLQYFGLQSTLGGTTSPLWLFKDTFSSVQELSVQISYNCSSSQLDFSLASVHELKTLIENITQKLPATLPPETPQEVRDFIESLLSIAASASSSRVSLVYADGEAEFATSAAIEGNLDDKLNNIKDTFFNLVGASYDQYNLTLPWQLVFLNQTEIDLNNFQLSARLDENTFEGSIEGLVLTPLLDDSNGTHFTLERLFNLTAPQYPWQPEFPGMYQNLEITVVGGSNATHGVAIFRNPATGQAPDATADHQMIWHNVTLSSLKSLIFVVRKLSQSDLGWIVGQVVDAESSAPIAEAVVTVEGTSTTTDAYGWYIISDVAPEDHTVTVSALDYATAKKLVHQQSGVTTTASFELEEGGTVEGTVTDASTELPISGANVSLDGYTKTTDAEGHYSLLVPANNYTITVTALGYLSDSKTRAVETHATTTVNFALLPAGTLTITTSPVSGEVFVNGTSWGFAPQSKAVKVGTYKVTFGPVAGYETSTWQLAVVQKGIETTINGVYLLINGTLTVNTSPISGEVFVNGVLWGTSPQSRVVLVGNYTVSFGDVTGYHTPLLQHTTVKKDLTTVVEGVYEPITGTITIATSPVSGEIFVNGESWGYAPGGRTVHVGTYTITFGEVSHCYTPSPKVVEVYEDVETGVEGVYTPRDDTVIEVIEDPELVNAANPFIVDASERAETMLKITGISGAVVITVTKLTEAPGVSPPPGTWKLLGSYVEISMNETDASVNATIRMYYTHGQLATSGLDESTLTIYCWDDAAGEWVAVESHVSVDEDFVWADVDHLSCWTLMAKPPESWTPAIVVIAIAIIVIITAAVIVKKRKQSPPKQ